MQDIWRGIDEGISLSKRRQCGVRVIEEISNGCFCFKVLVGTVNMLIVPI